MPAAHTHHVYPLSPLQHGMLSHYSGQRADGVDLVQIVLNLPEALPADAFARAWQWLARRHAIFRTTFHAGNTALPPAQQVHDRVAVDFAWHDWRSLGAATREEKWAHLLATDRARGINLAEAPLWRVNTVQLSEREHRVVFTVHHLLLDARALLVILPELFAACEAFAAGREPVAAGVRPYRDYIDWLQAADFTPSIRYWSEALAGFRTPTPLPLAGAAGPAGPAGAPGSQDRTLRLDAAHTAALQQFARSHGVTMNTLVQAAWALVLARCSGEDDVVFGAVRACRHNSVAGAESLVGPLINTVPLRVTFPAGMSVGEWLRALRRQWTDLRPHEHVALSALRPWTDIPAGTPLFDTVVSYQEPGWDVTLQALGGPWANRTFEVHNQVNHPLALDVAGGTRLQLRISYDPARFTAAGVDRLLGLVATVLDGLAAHPDRMLADLPLLAAADEARLLEHWSSAPAEFGEPVCVHDQFARSAALYPQALAVADAHHSLTYAALDRRAAALAARLQALGAAPGVFVGVCVQPSVNLVVALLGVLKAGAAYLPMDPAYPAERLAFMATDAGVRLLVTEGNLAALFAAADLQLVDLDAPESPAASQPPFAPRPAGLDDPAYLIYTSGSTGVPKGVPVRHRALANLVAWHRQAYAVTAADRATQLASPAFDACVWELWPYLAAGASIHLPDADVRLAPARLARWLVTHQITLTFIPTPLAEALLDETWPAGSALRGILTGGDRLRRWPGSALPCPLFNHYGPTESTVVATWAEVPRKADGSAAPAIGRPIANTEVYVLDARRQPVPVGVPGELHLGGAGLADGYHRRPELTAERFVPHPFDRTGTRKLYRTGDLVRWREDGQLDYIGRLDQQVKIRGHRIEPGEIEAALNAHPAVRESLVIAREDAARQPQLAAYYLPRPGQPGPAPAMLADALHRRLPAYMVPASFTPLEAWPLTAHGKIDRAALPAPARAGAGAPAPVAPRPGVESIIASIWTEVLGCPSPGTGDDFFALGGHSLRAAQVITRLNAALNVPLTVRDLFEHSTIASLATAIALRRTAGARPAAPAAPELVPLP